MIRLLDDKSHFQQVLDETGINRKSVRRHWLEMCSSMQRYMDGIVYDTVPLFDWNEIVEIDEAYMHWKAGVLTIQWGDEVVVEEGGDWVVGLISRHSEDPGRSGIKLFLAEGRATEDLIDEIEACDPAQRLRLHHRCSVHLHRSQTSQRTTDTTSSIRRKRASARSPIR